MKIRLMKINDYNQVHKLWCATDGIGMRKLDDSYEGISKFLLRNPKTNFVVEKSNNIIGVILCGHDGRRGHIYHMVVDKKYRKNGIGRLLLDTALNSLKEEGINKVALTAFCKNEIGNKFWESVGFNKRDDLIYRNKSINTEND
ncbi:MAG: GNAT family N-acetyltransferase [Firmicutes bacterium]|nr:GNAT family N-acetyltransferase [Bacillota bacterium]